MFTHKKKNVGFSQGSTVRGVPNPYSEDITDTSKENVKVMEADTCDSERTTGGVLTAEIVLRGRATEVGERMERRYKIGGWESHLEVLEAVAVDEVHLDRPQEVPATLPKS